MCLPVIPFAVVVPTLNPGPQWEVWLTALGKQTAQPSRLLVIDSGSDDGAISAYDQDGFELVCIPREHFNHGASRQFAFEQVSDEVIAVVFMTQDAVLADERALEKLLSAFEDSEVAAAYGRQLPAGDAGPFGAHARLFNYGAASMIKQWGDREQLGIRTCFLSNSFAAYRCEDLAAIGGFPRTHFGEDMLVAARLLVEGRQIAYVADACVYHSHDYSLLEEFRRYLAVGQLHSRHTWLLDAFGAATGEGRRFVQSEMLFLLRNAPHLLPLAVIRTVAKYLGYRAGRMAGRWGRFFAI